VSRPLQPIGDLFAEVEAELMATEKARRAAMTPEEIAAERARALALAEARAALPDAPEDEDEDEEEEEEEEEDEDGDQP